MVTKINEEGGKTTIVVAGRLDTINAEKFMTELNGIGDEHLKSVEIDCTELEYISSSGLRAFITLLKRSQKNGGNIVLTGMNKSVREVFDITGFSNLFTIK